MRFSIVTPSFRSSQWLRLCIASIADQEGVQLEHIVQDACSDDGTQDWLPSERRVKAFIEKDGGMYDAINRGFRRCSGDILAYLNCDEQYLPGALKAVHDFFAAHPQIDVVLPDTIVTDAGGNYMCHRLSLVPGKHQMWVRFPVVTSSLFIHRRVIEEKSIFFDTRWRILGDWFWVKEFVDRGLRMAVLPRFASIFTDTGDNLCLKPSAQPERDYRDRMAPRWVKLLERAFVLQYRLQLMLRRPLLIKPFDYSIYTLESPSQRVIRRAAKPTSFWVNRHGLKTPSPAPASSTA